MAIRVAQVATGNAGKLTLRQLIDDPRFELVAVSTSNPDKVGKDAGELAGLDVTTGVVAVGALAERIEAKRAFSGGWSRPSTRADLSPFLLKPASSSRAAASASWRPASTWSAQRRARCSSRGARCLNR